MLNYLKSLFCKKQESEKHIKPNMDKLHVSHVEVVDVIIEFNVVVSSTRRSRPKMITDHRLPFQVQMGKIYTRIGMFEILLQTINTDHIRECYECSKVEIKDNTFIVKAPAYQERVHDLRFDFLDDVSIRVSKICEFPNQPPPLLRQLQLYFSKAISFANKKIIIEENDLDEMSFLKELDAAYLVYNSRGNRVIDQGPGNEK